MQRLMSAASGPRDTVIKHSMHSNIVIVKKKMLTPT